MFLIELYQMLFLVLMCGVCVFIQLLRALGDGNGAGPGQLDNPNGLDWGGAEVNEPNLAVADQNNHRIQVNKNKLFTPPLLFFFFFFFFY